MQTARYSCLFGVGLGEALVRHLGGASRQGLSDPTRTKPNGDGCDICNTDRVAICSSGDGWAEVGEGTLPEADIPLHARLAH